MTEPQVRRSRNPARTRKAILDAATAEFAAKGLGGARVDEIAARSGLNKALIYHYFGAKEDLFRTVLEAIYERLGKAERTLELKSMTPRMAIEVFIEFLWDFYLTHPEYITLLNSENLHQTRHIKDSKHIRGVRKPFLRMLDGVLTRGAAEGVFRPGVDPAQLHLTIAALSYFYLSNNGTLSVFYGRDLRTPRALAAWRRHMSEMIFRFLAPETPLTSLDSPTSP